MSAGEAPRSRPFLFRRVADLLVRPNAAWQEIKAERTTAARLLLGYVAVLAGIAVIERALLSGFRLYAMGIEGPEAWTALWRTFWENVPFFVVDLLNLYLVGRIANGLFPPPEDEQDRGLRLAAYASTPLWVARIVIPFDLPVVGWFALAAVLYFPYLLYRGASVLLDLPPRRAAGATAVLALAAALIVGIVNYILYIFVL